MMETTQGRARTEVDPLLRCMGKAWSLGILRCLNVKRKLGFGEIRDHLGASAKVLSERLKELEALDLVKRKVMSQTTPLNVVYSITQEGDRIMYHIEKMLK
jgi:DNA-binding HxlR family transcriptional regulator